MRPRGDRNGKDSHFAGGKVCGKGSWLSAASLEIRSKRLRKLLLMTLFPFQDLLLKNSPLPLSPGYFHKAFFYQGHPFTEDLHSGSVGMGDISGTSKLGQQLSHVVLSLRGEGGCVVPATSRWDCKCTKWVLLAPGGLGRLLKHLP